MIAPGKTNARFYLPPSGVGTTYKVLRRCVQSLPTLIGECGTAGVLGKEESRMADFGYLVSCKISIGDREGI
jgi:hypothetical protein